MDLFFFRSSYDEPSLYNGEAINNVKSVRWVERYRNPGEFEIKAGVSSNLRTILQLGTIISHFDTLEPMIVESITIDDDVKDEEPQVVIGGRSLETWLKQRFVGGDIETYVLDGHRLLLNNIEYTLAEDTSWAQVVTLIANHINTTSAMPNDEVDEWVPISDQQHIGPSTSQARTIRKQNLHSAVLELLAVDDFGIQAVRPNPDNVDPSTVEFRIHNGFDRSDSVIFSHAFGDLEKAQYFWSDIALKTDYYCVSNYFELRSDSAQTGSGRRVMYVDCSDIDGHLDIEDANTLSVQIGDAMDIRGQQMLRAQVRASLLSTDISRKTRYKFKRDYDIGDLVTVNGNYDVESVMRVVEHVTFQDENGETGYPTLSMLNE